MLEGDGVGNQLGSFIGSTDWTNPLAGHFSVRCTGSMLDDCGLPCRRGSAISLAASKVEFDSVVNRGRLLCWSLMIWSTCEDNEDRPLDRADRISQDQGVRKERMGGPGMGSRWMGRSEAWVGIVTIAATRERERESG